MLQVEESGGGAGPGRRSACFACSACFLCFLCRKPKLNQSQEDLPRQVRCCCSSLLPDAPPSCILKKLTLFYSQLDSPLHLTSTATIDPSSSRNSPAMAESSSSSTPSHLRGEPSASAAPPPLQHHTSELGQRYGRADHLVYHNEGPEGEVTKFRHLFKRPTIRQVSHLGHPGVHPKKSRRLTIPVGRGRQAVPRGEPA